MNADGTFNKILVKLFNEITELEQKSIVAEVFKDISKNDMHILDSIGIEKPKNMSMIAKDLKITVGTLTIAINNLVKKGYVIRTRGKEDKRVVFISLTTLGLKAYRHYNEFHEKMIDATLEGLDEEEALVLVKAMNNLSEYFKNQSKDKE